MPRVSSRLIALVAIPVLAFGVGACGGGETVAEDRGPYKTWSDDSLMPALDATAEAFDLWELPDVSDGALRQSDYFSSELREMMKKFTPAAAAAATKWSAAEFHAEELPYRSKACEQMKANISLVRREMNPDRVRQAYELNDFETMVAALKKADDAFGEFNASLKNCVADLNK